MRIVSGLYKGRRITAPKKLPIRPTTDMAKESLFNILNNQYYFDDISVLDLFSGSGNISYEFASRGTNQITAVDSHHGCIKFINETAESFDMNITTIKSDVFKFLERSQQQHTIVPVEEFSKIPQLVFQNKLLEENGVLIVEHSKHTDLSHLEHYNNSRSYGGNMFSFFQ